MLILYNKKCIVDILSIYCCQQCILFVFLNKNTCQNDFALSEILLTFDSKTFL